MNQVHQLSDSQHSEKCIDFIEFLLFFSVNNFSDRRNASVLILNILVNWPEMELLLEFFFEMLFILKDDPKTKMIQYQKVLRMTKFSFVIEMGKPNIRVQTKSESIWSIIGRFEEL